MKLRKPHTLSLICGLVCSAALLNYTDAADRTGNPQGGSNELLQPSDPKPAREGGGQGKGMRKGDGKPGGGGGEGRGKGPGGKGGADPKNFIFRTEIPEHPYDIILSRPTRNSITVSIMLDRDAQGTILYGVKAGTLNSQTAPLKFKQGEPLHASIEGLKPDTQYFYRVQYKPAGSEKAELTPESSFHTARPPGSAFTFTVQADSHLDFGTVPQVYTKTLANELADRPDFLFELGDTFMNDKRPKFTDALPQYIAQRYYFGLACHSVPLCFVIGNHDGEAGWRREGADSMAVWSNQTRRKYFANPFPDGFYTGNTRPDAVAGRLENYYAWEWGDALFVVLDPFWYTTGRNRTAEDNWVRTLGRDQYDWLRKTLESSRAKYKFLFLHHLVGGSDREGRGGVEAAKFFEWGGQTLDGKNEFSTRRSGWGDPIHAMLVKNHVSAVFHGHDHLYVRQELDGVTYMEVPQPSHPDNKSAQSAEEYGYKSGVIQGSPGHVRVRVSPEQAVIEFVKSRQPSEESQGKKNAEVVDRLAIPATPAANARRASR